MSKITTNLNEVKQLDNLFPGEDDTFGTAYLPRGLEASMFELLQWPHAEHPSDFKKHSVLFRDKITKTGTAHALTHL